MNFGKRLRWFTLVEMLIVIVIIWVLAAALIPRLTSVRWRANDVARKADLQQVATAIVSHSMDKGTYPTPTLSTWVAISDLTGDLKNYVTVLPKDPTMDWNDDFNEYNNDWDYAYIRITKWGTPDAWFAIISMVETEWWANWVFSWWWGWFLWWLTWWTDSQYIIPCTSFTEWAPSIWTNWACTYSGDTQLRYIIAR